MTEHTPEKVAELTDAEWREFQSIPEQGYSHRHWVNHKIAQRLEAVSTERDEALAVIADIRREVEDFTQSDNDALCAIEHRLSRIPEHPKED